MTNSDALFLFQGGYLHKAHVGFAEGIDADLRHFESAAEPTPDHADQDVHSEVARLRAATELPTGYDVVVAEGSAALQTLVWYGWLRDRDTSAVFLACDETFRHVSRGHMHHVWQALKLLSRRVDGCLSISELVQAWVRPYLPSARHEIVYPTTTPAKFDALKQLEIRLQMDELTLLSVGSARSMKNYSSLVEAVARLRNRMDTSIKLTLVGAAHEYESYANEPFVETPGFVSQSELFRRMERSCLYIQPSKGDGFGVAALEAMLAGLPVLVSDETGLMELLDPSWITGTDPDQIVEDLQRVLEMDPDHLIAVGERNRARAVEFSPTRQAERFSRAIELIV